MKKKEPEDRLFSKTSPKPPCWNIENSKLVTLQSTMFNSRYEVAGTWLLHALNYFLKYSHSLFPQGKKKWQFSEQASPIVSHNMERICPYLNCFGWALHHAIYCSKDSLFRNFNPWKSGKVSSIWFSWNPNPAVR